ncbi:uncharacterized protein LOC121385782 [Gigantopelta aegis]|uniref:uncharacterized protein LOC121385782 n=1 Tax=Gigantopelta aegis TaxID=1735272 RepID=UPI001B88C5AB|nr:uncharacterized protein LOC121385782 [Gigantopelta aegis]
MDSNSNLTWKWKFMNESWKQNVPSLLCNASEENYNQNMTPPRTELHCNLSVDLFSDMTSLLFSAELVSGWRYVHFQCFDAFNESQHKDIYLMDTKIGLYTQLPLYWAIVLTVVPFLIYLVTSAFLISVIVKGRTVKAKQPKEETKDDCTDGNTDTNRKRPAARNNVHFEEGQIHVWLENVH